MSNIISIENVRRWFKKTGPKIGWTDILYDRLPVLSLRNRNDWCDWPLCWGRQNSSLDLAVDLSIQLLVPWQAFRPLSLKARPKTINKLRRNVPAILYSFQEQMIGLGTHSFRDAVSDEARLVKVVDAAVAAVDEVSSFKGDRPMLGSKILSFLLPEFFPIWDTEWVEQKALSNEVRIHEHPYKNYLLLMAREYALHNDKYSEIASAYVKGTDASRELIEWHFADLGPMIFEACLLSKHVR